MLPKDLHDEISRDETRKNLAPHLLRLSDAVAEALMSEPNDAPGAFLTGRLLKSLDTQDSFEKMVDSVSVDEAAELVRFCQAFQGTFKLISKIVAETALMNELSKFLGGK